MLQIHRRDLVSFAAGLRRQWLHVGGTLGLAGFRVLTIPNPSSSPSAA